MSYKKICVSKKLSYLLLFFLVLTIGVLYFNKKISSSKLSYQSKAAPPKSPKKIFGGTEVTDPTKWPFMVLLNVYKLSSVNICSGTLIAPDWILTAAHCVAVDENSVIPVDESSIKVIIGSTKYWSLPDENSLLAKDYYYYPRPNGIKMHPQYDGENKNDLALIHLTRSIPSRDEKRKIIALSSDYKLGIKDTTVISSQWAVLLGVGITEIDVAGTLYQGILPYYFNSSADENKWYSIGIDGPAKFAAGYPMGRVCGTGGDSGGSLIKQINGTWVQLGVTIGTHSPCDTAYSATHLVNIAYYIDWIKNNVVYLQKLVCNNTNGVKKCYHIFDKSKGTFQGVGLKTEELDEYECRVNNNTQKRPSWLPSNYKCGYEVRDYANVTPTPKP